MDRICFVISPIGAEGTDTREHADAVFNYIIKPAMEPFNIKPVRADQDCEPGSISDQMLRGIKSADVCIAVLTDYNPNVLYELALAQVAGRPVIALLEKKDGNPPFDIKDLRCVYYDLKPKPLFAGDYVKEISKHIQGLENESWKVDSPFASAFPDGFGPNPDFTFYKDLEEYGGTDALLTLLEDAKEKIKIMGTTLAFCQQRDQLVKVLDEQAKRGCDIAIMILHPDNPVLRARIAEAARDKRENQLLQDIEGMRQALMQLDERYTNVEMRQILHGCPHCKVILTEETAVYAPYFCSERMDVACLWRCASKNPLYTLVLNEFETFWAMNAHI